MIQPAIRVIDLSKKFNLVHTSQRYRTLRDTLAQPFQRTATPTRNDRDNGRQREEFWALRNLSFEVQRGEVVGVIGRNGAGKSTLLKILSRISEPTSGHAEIRGSVGSLLEVGAGFHDELTGRENIYLSGAVYGMRKLEIAKKLDSIVDFADIAQFLDTPVKRYSSGMYMRLAFSVAAHLETDILLVDEVLAVGDAAFQRKCLGRMKDVGTHGRTVLFVSHNLAAIHGLCRSVLVLRDGSLGFYGDVAVGITGYTNQVSREVDLSAKGPTRWLSVDIVSTGDQGPSIAPADPLIIVGRLRLDAPFESALLKCLVYNASGDVVLDQQLDARKQHSEELEAATYTVRVAMPALWLAPGAYTVGFRLIGRPRDSVDALYVSDRAVFQVDADGVVPNVMLAPPAEWNVELCLETNHRAKSRT
jgi:lipopolysaccharide transport system ATP-binding protein